MSAIRYQLKSIHRFPHVLNQTSISTVRHVIVKCTNSVITFLPYTLPSIFLTVASSVLTTLCDRCDYTLQATFSATTHRLSSLGIKASGKTIAFDNNLVQVRFGGSSHVPWQLISLQ